MTLRADTLVLFWKDRHSNWSPSIFLQISLFSFEKGNERQNQDTKCSGIGVQPKTSSVCSGFLFSLLRSVHMVFPCTTQGFFQPRMGTVDDDSCCTRLVRRLSTYAGSLLSNISTTDTSDFGLGILRGGAYILWRDRQLSRYILVHSATSYLTF